LTERKIPGPIFLRSDRGFYALTFSKNVGSTPIYAPFGRLTRPYREGNVLVPENTGERHNGRAGGKIFGQALKPSSVAETDRTEQKILEPTGKSSDNSDPVKVVLS